MLPLLVHLVFHPASTTARSLAIDLHRALNDDPALPGLRIPTRLCPEDGTGLPPTVLDLDLDQAEHSAVVVLADDDMLLDPDSVPSGRQSWSAFVGDLGERCRGSDRHRFLPAQLTENAWPLDPRLGETSFFRAYLHNDPAWLARRVIVELVRLLAGKGRGDRAPVRLFLSHAKQDIQHDPLIFRAIATHLDNTQPVEAWVDSAKIAGGSSFAEEIDHGVQNSAVLALITNTYSGRTWCRREILLAKKHARPVVVVYALSDLDRRAFPYVGNVPLLSWTPGAEARAVDLILKEYLRSLHVGRELQKSAASDDVVLAAPPELATLVHVSRGAAVLYPDPPLGDEELQLLAPLGHRLETPLQRAASGRPLTGLTIALSISESDDARRFGVLPAHLDAALLEISRHLLVRGATLSYGGHFGSDGYTLALFEMIRAHQMASGLPPIERLISFVGWPWPFAKGPRVKYRAQATFVRVPRPDGILTLDPATFVDDPDFFAADSPERRYAWARGMTAMRQEQTRCADARIVLGSKAGPTTHPEDSRKEIWYLSQLPGVVEEALLTLEAGKPLYIVGAYGGVGALLADLLEGHPRTDFSWEFHKRAPHAEGMRDLYRSQGVPFLDYPDVAHLLQTAGVRALSDVNGLTVDQNRELFMSREPGRILELVLAGLTSRFPR